VTLPVASGPASAAPAVAAQAATAEKRDREEPRQQGKKKKKPKQLKESKPWPVPSQQEWEQLPAAKRDLADTRIIYNIPDNEDANMHQNAYLMQQLALKLLGMKGHVMPAADAGR
jgi:hypothetical protein